MNKFGFCCAVVLGIPLVWLTLAYVHPIATQRLVLRLHPRDPDRAAVAFVALGDMGTGDSAQTQVAHAMYSVCQRDGCDFVLGLGDNIYPHSVQSAHDAQFQAKFEQPYSLFQDIDFWMILGITIGRNSGPVPKRKSIIRSTVTAGASRTPITPFRSCHRGSISTV